MINYRYEQENRTNLSAEAMNQLLQDNRAIISRDNHMTLIKHDVSYEYGGISKGGGANMIGLIALSIAFGVVLNMIKEEGLPLVTLFRSVWSASMKLVEIIMWYVALYTGLSKRI
jgi:Na+/H+-dicarboxylate symporter